MATNHFSRWSHIDRTGHLSGRTADSPGRGVWIQSENVEGDFQHTVEHIAVNGDSVKSMHCYHGHGRRLALQAAVTLATSS